MAEIAHARFSRPAAADLSTNQYFFVWHDSSGQFALSGAGERGYPLQNKPDRAGAPAEIEKVGWSECIAGAAILAGAEVTSDASGKAVTATIGTRINGTAMTAAAADGDKFTLDPSNAGAVSP